MFATMIFILMSRPDFSSHDGIYYIPLVGNPTPNPEHQVMSIMEENIKNNNLNKKNKAEARQNKYIQNNLEVTITELSKKEYKSQKLTTTKCASKTTRLAKTKKYRIIPKIQVLTLVSGPQLQ